MIAINHALTGALVGLTVHHPAVALPLAFGSHFICDAIPHFGTKHESSLRSGWFQRYLLVDAALCVLLVLVLFVSGPKSWLLAAFCAFVAAAPDFLWIRKYTFMRRSRKFHPWLVEKWASGIQWFQKPIGALVEVAWFSGAVIILAQFL